MASGDLIVHADDGKLYRVSRQQLTANPVPPGDPAAQHAPNLAALANNLKTSVGPVIPHACVFAMVETGGPTAPGKNS
jgi:hypothetical protein